ncbi:MAG: DUF4384 domain-containing protein [bacterium]|nr:DUF4384 domain-containing protein [Candidatus Sumerlaeota bacterium]
MKKCWIVLTALVWLMCGLASAVGVQDGTYRTNNEDEAPADITDNVRIIPPPTGGDLRVRIRADHARYHVGDSIKINFGVNRDSNVFIFDTDASGLTHQIFPNYYDRSNFLRAGKTYYIPDRSYDLEISPPSGNNTLTIIAVARDYPFLGEWRQYTHQDPYPASREGAAALVRRIESFRHEPSAMSVQPLRPAPRENLWAEDTTTFYVMENYGEPDYRAPRWGMLDVDTYPNNARIYIDSDYYGRSPQVIERLQPGYRRIRLTKEGYQPYECNVYIRANQTKELDIFLEPTPTQQGYSRGNLPINGQGWGFFSPNQ